jgi:hypothetical protein
LGRNRSPDDPVSELTSRPKGGKSDIFATTTLTKAHTIFR